MSEVQRQALVRSLSSRLPAIEFDALRVIDRVVQRLELGRERHGELDLSKPRDWQRERFEERLDALVYDVCAELAAEDRARAALQEAARVEMLGDVAPPGTAVAEYRDRESQSISIRARSWANHERPIEASFPVGDDDVELEAHDPYEGRTPWPHPNEAEPVDDVEGEAG